ncbi:DUF6778 family protein [Sedimentitalea sp. HM32M-2]|uniref:DUF6778 family protein n=1 Tax=Sedimentitalea sp. HM32M-2 TaxID=3351566 RepID=UPI0036284DD1
MTHDLDSAPAAAGGNDAGLLGVLRRAGRMAVLAPALMLLAACGGEWVTDYGEPLDGATTRGWRVSAVQVTVPDTLTVSEENVYIPNADIVWHGDPPGDRKAQVQAIIRDAARQATAGLRGGRPVVLAITLQEFHGVTPIAMARSPEAVYNIAFTAQVTDARNGAALTPATLINADLPALVREDAVTAAQFGPSQKQRVTGHVTAVIKGWLGIGPDIRGSFASLGR